MIFNGQTQPSLYRDRDVGVCVSTCIMSIFIVISIAYSYTIIPQVFSAGSPSQVFNSATNQMYSQQSKILTCALQYAIFTILLTPDYCAWRYGFIYQI